MNEEENQESKETGLVSEAQKAIADLKTENDRRENILQREQELQAIKQLGGETEAGKPSEELTETNEDYTKKVMMGR